MASSPADTSAHTNAGAQRSTTPPPAADEIKDTANGPSTPKPPSIGKNPTTGTPPSTTPDTSSSANTAPPPKTADPTPPSTRTTTTTSATNTNTTTTTTTTTTHNTHNTTQTTPCPSSRHPQPPTQAPPTDKTTHRLHTRFTLAPCLQCLVSRHPATHAACIAQRRRGAACAACERRGEGAVCVGLRVRTAREMWEAELEVLRRAWRGEEGGCSEEEEEEEEEEGEVLVQGFVVVRGSGESEESWGRKREVWRGLEGVVEGRKGRDFAPRLGVGEGVGRKEDERVRDRGLLRGGVGAVGKRSWLRRWDEEDQEHDGGGGEDGQEDAGRDPIDDLRAAASLLRSKAWRLSRTHWVEVEGAGGRKWERRERSEKEQAEWMDGLEIGKALQESRRLLLETAKWQIETGQNWRRQFMRNQTL